MAFRESPVLLETTQEDQIFYYISRNNTVKALLGTKIGMTQIIAADGVVTPITLVQAGPCTVTQIKTTDTDGYDAVQIGFGDAKAQTKAVAGHTKSANVTPKFIREIRKLPTSPEVAIGDSFTVSVFEVGDEIDVTGTSKGKGWAGTIKRHNFQRQRKTHGGKGNTRRPGSIGSMYPQKIFKGKRMAGRMGGDQVTVHDLTVALVDEKQNVIGIKGAVPGPRKGLIVIKESF